MKKIIFSLMGLVFFASTSLQAWPGNADNSKAAPQTTSSQNAPSDPNPKASITTDQDEPNPFNNSDPFDEMATLQDSMNRVFKESVRRMRNFQQSGRFFEPDLDLLERPDSYLIKIDLPGMEKDQIKVDMVDQNLIVSGERKKETIVQNDQEGFYQSERSSGAFKRSIPLPADAKTDQIAAKYDKGVLEITIPRIAQPKQDGQMRIAIQ
jgi:HSP20 family protein